MIPYSRPKHSDLYTLSLCKLCLKTIPFTAAHTYIAHIRQYPPPRAKIALSAGLAQSAERLTAEGEVARSISHGGADTHGLKITET